MPITPRTVSISVEVQGTALSIKDIKDTVRSVVQGAMDGNVRSVQANVIQGTRRKAKKGKGRG